MKSEYAMALVFRILGLLLGLQAIAFIPGMVWATSEPLSAESTTWRYVMPQVLGWVLCLAVAYVLKGGPHLVRFAYNSQTLPEEKPES